MSRATVVEERPLEDAVEDVDAELEDAGEPGSRGLHASTALARAQDAPKLDWALAELKARTGDLWTHKTVGEDELEQYTADGWMLHDTLSVHGLKGKMVTRFLLRRRPGERPDLVQAKAEYADQVRVLEEACAANVASAREGEARAIQRAADADQRWNDLRGAWEAEVDAAVLASPKYAQLERAARAALVDAKAARERSEAAIKDLHTQGTCYDPAHADFRGSLKRTNEMLAVAQKKLVQANDRVAELEQQLAKAQRP